MTQEAGDPRSRNKPRDEAPRPRSESADGAEDSARKQELKERVLHTRVPAVLERELKRFAVNLRIPVSNLVRAILQDALTVADVAGDQIEERLKSAAKHIGVERERLKKRVHLDPLAGVFAFQDVTLAQPATCAKCDKELARGVRAHLGMTEGPKRGPSIVVCQQCLPRG